MAEPIQEAAAKIDERINELQRELEQLEEAKEALAGVTGSTGRADPRRSPPRRPRPRGRVDRSAELKTIVARDPQIRPAELAREMGVSSQQVHGVIKRLRDAGQLRRDDEQGFVILTD